MRIHLAWCLALTQVTACDDYLLVIPRPDPADPTDRPDPTDTDTQPQGWCAVDALFQQECVVCHSTSGALGGLDLQTDAHAAIVGVDAALGGGRVLVTPGNPDTSFLYTKIAGPLASGDGAKMPPGVSLPEADLAVVRTWIQDGASDACDSPIVDTAGTSRHHPEGFAIASEHGRAAKFQEETCVTCHGPTLEGVGSAVSCDTCHEAGWRTDCTFCHGAPMDGTGSPPRHLSGVDDGLNASFIPHRVHTGPTAIKVAFDCTTCHDKPVDVLSVGHLFVGDTTPGVAEVDLSDGLSPAGRWNASNGTCSNLYCHGNGLGNNGSIAHTADVDGCGDCHPGPGNRGRWSDMSGEHDKHLDEAIGCWECHGDTVMANNTISDTALHVDGTPDIALRSPMQRGAATCSGTCHGEVHTNRRW